MEKFYFLLLRIHLEESMSEPWNKTIICAFLKIRSDDTVRKLKGSYKLLAKLIRAKCSGHKTKRAAECQGSLTQGKSMTKITHK